MAWRNHRRVVYGNRFSAHLSCRWRGRSVSRCGDDIHLCARIHRGNHLRSHPACAWKRWLNMRTNVLAVVWLLSVVIASVPSASASTVSSVYPDHTYSAVGSWEISEAPGCTGTGMYNCINDNP